MFRHVRLLMPLGCLCLALTTLPGHALESDRRQPINVEADRATIDKKTGTSTYSGHVIVTQGSMRIAADSLTVYTRDGTLSKLQADGKPVEFQQHTESSKTVNASAERMTYDAGSQTVVFEQGARLSQGANTFSSNRIVYNLSRDTVDAGKRTGGDRVTITIQPGQNGN